MEFKIVYCKPCGYRERAEELAAELRERFGARVSLEVGGFGQFDVSLDGELVASKGNFLRRALTHGAPASTEVLARIERVIASR